MQVHNKERASTAEQAVDSIGDTHADEAIAVRGCMVHVQCAYAGTGVCSVHMQEREFADDVCNVSDDSAWSTNVDGDVDAKANVHVNVTTRNVGNAMTHISNERFEFDYHSIYPTPQPSTVTPQTQ